MKKLKVLATCALAVGVIAASSLTSLAAANKVNYNLYYTGTSVGSILNRTYQIDATGTRYKVQLESTSNNCQLYVVTSGGEGATVGKNAKTDYIYRTASPSGHMPVTGSIIHKSKSGGVTGYCQKM